MNKDISEFYKYQKNSDDDRTRIGDVFSNPEVDIGVGSTDPTMGAIYPRARSLTWNLQRIESVMRADPFFVRALEYRSSKPIINGVDVSSDEIDTEELSQLQKSLQSQIYPAIKNALFEADAFGWSGSIIVIDGQMNKRDLKRPLRKKDLQKGKFLGLKTLTRWYQLNPTHEMITELGSKHEIYDPELLGTPLYYNVSFDGDRGRMYKVHRSRLIITSRNKLSYIEKKIEHYGGTSLLEQSFESLSRYHAFVGQINRIMHKSTVPVLKIDDLASAGLQTDQGTQQVEKKIEFMRNELNANNLIVIGDNDDLTFADAQTQGLSEMLKEFRKEVGAAFNTPPHILFHEMQDYDKEKIDDFIKTRQQFKVLPFLEKIIPIVFINLFGKEIPEYDVTFKPLENPTMQEMADARLKNVEAIEKIFQMGAYNTKSVQDTLPDIDRNPSDIFRNIDQEYTDYILSLGPEYGYLKQQIEMAAELNQEGAEAGSAKSQGKNKGGDPNTAKKSTPRPDMNKGKKGE